MEQSERRIGEPYLQETPFIRDIINLKRTDFDTLSYSDKVECCVQWYRLLHEHEQEIKEDASEVGELVFQYLNITRPEDLGRLNLSNMDIWRYLKKRDYIPKDALCEKIYLIDDECLLKDKPFLKGNADILEKELKESFFYDAPVGEELTPVKSYLQAIIDLDSILSCYRQAVGEAAVFVAYKQDEALKATASDFSPRANTAKCKEAEETLNTYFTPTEDFKLHNDSEKTDIQRIILGGILTEQDNNDYSDRKTEIKKKEVLNALSTLVKFYKPKDNWWNDLALHNKKQPKCKVLATITNCNEESIRTYSKKKEGEDDYEIKKALFGK